ncbi:hypothetical protein ANN_00866 [Periplaneta americana]|uniref:Uncharacterized protein n=1 Tax=Periplaneta americana TaxID=6978 RepID=A0ABQ8TTS2_PERAM|nr:hypothetical protein ANN_00866 [Periplaneta americana]
MKIDTSPKCDSNIKVVQTTNENPDASTVGSNSDPSNGSDINKVSFADVVKGRKMKRGMNNSSCLDVYGINSKILKIASVYIIESLAHIFNCCIDSGVFPNSFKFVKISLVPRSIDHFGRQKLSRVCHRRWIHVTLLMNDNDDDNDDDDDDDGMSQRNRNTQRKPLRSLNHGLVQHKLRIWYSGI